MRPGVRRAGPRLVLALVVVACGGGDDDAGKDSSDPNPNSC